MPKQVVIYGAQGAVIDARPIASMISKGRMNMFSGVKKHAKHFNAGVATRRTTAISSITRGAFKITLFVAYS